MPWTYNTHINTCRNYLLDGLEKIKTRGYDGAGLATMSPSGGGMVCTMLFLLILNKLPGRCGMHYSIEDLLYSIDGHLTFISYNFPFCQLYFFLASSIQSYTSINNINSQLLRNQVSMINKIQLQWSDPLHVPFPIIPLVLHTLDGPRMVPL